MPRRPAALTAAATVLPLKRPAEVKAKLGKRQEWQSDAWAYFDEVPELKQATWFLGNQMSKLRLFIAEVPDGDQEPLSADSEDSTLDPGVVAQAKVELARLRSGQASHGDMLRDLNMNLEIAAECYLVGIAAREQQVDPITGEVTREAQPEAWSIRSIDEVEVKGSGKSLRILIRDEEGEKGQPLDLEQDTVIRLYQKHPRFSARADCAMRGVLSECEALVTLHRQVLAEANSKASAGFFTVPNELQLGGDAQGSEDGQEAAEDPFMADMSEALVDPIADPSHPSATTPMLIRGPAEYLKPDVLRHIVLDRKASETLDTRIEERVRRLARGLNLPVEVVMGHQATTFANANQVDQDQFDDHLHPRCVLAVNALTLGFLRAQLRDESSPVRDHPDVDRVMVWFDPADLIRQPDLEGGADNALRLNAISLKAYRKAKGWSEEDAPTEEELLARQGLARGALSPEITLALLALLGVPLDVAQAVAALPAGGDSTGAQPEPDPDAAPDPENDDEDDQDPLARLRDAVQRGDLSSLEDLIGRRITAPPAPIPLAAAAGRKRSTTLGRQLVDLDRDLRTRLLVASDAALTRALDRAGARLRTKMGRRRELMAQVPNLQLAARLGREGMAELSVTPEDLLDGSFDGLRSQFMAWGATAQDQALELSARTVAGFTTAERAALKLRQADHLEEAWTWLEQHLRGFAQEQLFGAGAAATMGEVLDDLAVPAGLLRQAIARAGGAVLETTAIGGDAWTAVHPDGTPLGGIGTGDLIMGALAEHGAQVEGYVWVYGAAVRKNPFEPHAELDGVTFANFDDPVLANDGSFPEFAYFMPGDHAGCICDFEPAIITPEEA